MVTFYDYPKEHWRHLRTTNPVKSPFAALRLRTDAARRYKRVDRAIAVIWKMLMVAEKRFRRLQAPTGAQMTQWCPSSRGRCTPRPARSPNRGGCWSPLWESRRYRRLAGRRPRGA